MPFETCMTFFFGTQIKFLAEVDSMYISLIVKFNNKKYILWYILDTILSDFTKLCKWKYYL